LNFDTEVYGFNKLDGSNIRAYWKSPANEFTAFGTRKLPLKQDHKILGPSIDLIRSGYEEALIQLFKAKGYREVTAFFEYFGPHSFAGRHDMKDEMQVVLIDLMIYQKGLVRPEDFVQDYGHLGIPEVLFHGKIDEATLAAIREGTLPGMGLEGVVFKGRGGKKGNYPITFKVKSKQWIARLRELCGEDEALFEKLR